MARLGSCKTCHGKCSSETPRCPHCGQPSPLSCFAADTRIATPSGQTPISRLKVGDQVISFDVSSGSAVVRPITRVLQHSAGQIFEVRFAGGQRMRTTGLHPFLTERGWVRAHRLERGTRVLGFDGTRRYVEQAVLTSQLEPVFNLHTAGEHNFVAENTVAHNFIVLPTLRTLMHRLFVDPVVTLTQQPAS